jgi:NADH-quinone oxidoreductase subunit L
MQTNFNLIWFVLFLPVVGFLIQAFLGGMVVSKLGPAAGKKVMGTLAVLPIFIGFLIGAYLTFALAGLAPDQRSIHLELFEWIKLASVNIPFEFVVDPLSMTMVLIITGIGSLIHLYATGYMAEEKDYPRFFTYLNLFIAAMLILVLGNNLVMMFIGWEGVGLCSYLLIGFWYKDFANARAANKAFIVNRIGDWGLTLGMFLLFCMLAASAVHQHLDQAPFNNRLFSYDVMFGSSGHWINIVWALKAHPAIATAIALLLFVGAAGKSAQFPLYLWLPDAMAGPTPVSALIHAATMVTAGVFMLNRMHVVFEMSPTASAVVAGIGAFTALFAAVIAFGQTDIKKVLAYSTVSQLGFMFVACGAGAYWAGMFHVTTHAFFKALLFLGSGAVIHAMAHNQDMRNYGNLRKYLKITYWTMLTGTIAIAGLAFPVGANAGIGFAGFHSKEAIIGSALGNDFAQINGAMVGQYAGWLALFVAALTACYMFRMTMLTFFGNEERWRAIPAGAHDDHGHAHHEEHDHAHSPHDHGPDTFGFFYTEDELAAQHAANPEEHHHALDENHTPHEVPPSMYVPLIVLAFLSVVGGWYLSRPVEINGIEMARFQAWLYPDGLPILGQIASEPEGLPLFWLSFAAAVLGTIAGVAVYCKGLPATEGWDDKKWSPFRLAARRQFGYDEAMVTAAVEGGTDIGVVLWKGFDAGFIDFIVNAVGVVVRWFGAMLRKLQTGLARGYALLMLAGAVAIFAYLAWALSQAGVGQ